MGESPSRLTVRGVARALEGAPSGALARRTTVLDAENAVLVTHERFAPFEVETEEGRRVRVEVIGATRLGPPVRTKGAWGVLEKAHGYAFERAEQAPGPLAEVEVVTETIADGDSVRVSGIETDGAFEEHAGGLRDAAARTVRFLTADIATVGTTDAEHDGAIRERPKRTAAPAPLVRRTEDRPSRLWGQAFLVCAAICALVAAFVLVAFGLRPPVVDGIGVGLVFVAMWIYVGWLDVAPRFFGDPKAPPKRLSDPLYILLFPGTTGLAFAIADVITVSNEMPTNASLLVATSNAGGVLFLLAAHLWLNRRTRAILRTLHEAPPFTANGPLRGVWGAAQGVVRDPTPIDVDGAPGAIAQVMDIDEQPGSDPDIVTANTVTDGTFFVDGAGASYEVLPREAVWASMHPTARSKASSHERIIDAVPIGANALVAGRATRADGAVARIVARGPASLFFFAAPSEANARVEVALLAAAHDRVRTRLLACALAIVVATAALAHWLPAFYLPPGND